MVSQGSRVNRRTPSPTRPIRKEPGRAMAEGRKARRAALHEGIHSRGRGVREGGVGGFAAGERRRGREKRMA